MWRAPGWVRVVRQVLTPPSPAHSRASVAVGGHKKTYPYASNL